MQPFLLFLGLFLVAIFIFMGMSNKAALAIFMGFGILFIMGVSLDAEGLTKTNETVEITRVGSTYTGTFEDGAVTKTEDNLVLLLSQLFIYGSLAGMAISAGFVKVHQDETLLEYAKKRLGG